MGILLFILSGILEIILGSLFIGSTVIYYLVTLKWKTGARRVDRYFYQLALGKDQYGNIFLEVPLNKIMTKGSQTYLYGDEDDTISYVTAMNYFKKKSSLWGRILGKILNFAEKDHLRKAVLNKVERDIEGLQRLQQSGIVKDVLYQTSRTDDLDFLLYVNRVANKGRNF